MSLQSETNETRKASVTRREFVKSTAVAGAAMAAPLSVAHSAWAGGSDTLRVGLIGCGGRGTGAASQSMHSDPSVMLTAMADAFPDRIDASLGRLQADEAIRDKLRVEKQDRYSGFDCYKGLIDSGVDVVLMATPPIFRPIHLQYAVERGKHVFCEKPVAVDAPGVRSVIETAKRAKAQNTALMSGFCWRYATHMRDTFARLREGAIGQVRSLQSTYNTGPLGDHPREPGMSDTEWQLRNWKAFIHLSGDHIIEQAIHAIDWMSWAMGDKPPVKAWGTGGRLCREGQWTGNIYDHFAIVYEYEDGARGYHMCRQIANCDNDNTAYFLGSEGSVTINPWGPRCVIDGAESWQWRGRRNDMYQTEHDELTASIRAGEPINDGEWMTLSTMLGIMGRMCAYTGRTLTYEQCLNSQESLTPQSWEWGDAEIPPVPWPSKTEFV